MKITLTKDQEQIQLWKC